MGRGNRTTRDWLHTHSRGFSKVFKWKISLEMLNNGKGKSEATLKSNVQKGNKRIALAATSQVCSMFHQRIPQISYLKERRLKNNDLWWHKFSYKRRFLGQTTWWLTREKISYTLSDDRFVFKYTTGYIFIDKLCKIIAFCHKLVKRC